MTPAGPALISFTLRGLGRVSVASPFQPGCTFPVSRRASCARLRAVVPVLTVGIAVFLLVTHRRAQCDRGEGTVEGIRINSRSAAMDSAPPSAFSRVDVWMLIATVAQVVLTGLTLTLMITAASSDHHRAQSARLEQTLAHRGPAGSCGEQAATRLAQSGCRYPASLYGSSRRLEPHQERRLPSAVTGLGRTTPVMRPPAGSGFTWPCWPSRNCRPVTAHLLTTTRGAEDPIRTARTLSPRTGKRARSSLIRAVSRAGSNRRQ